MIRKTLLTPTLLLLLVGMAFPVTVTINPTMDAAIYESSPEEQMGSLNYCWTGIDDGNCDSLILFSLDDYTYDEFLEATLEVYVYTYWETIPSINWIAKVADDWDEDTVCWENNPGFDDTLIVFFTDIPLDEWCTIDVTPIVKVWLQAGDPNFGFYVSSYEDPSGEDAFWGVQFYSKEYPDLDRHPKLNLVFGFTTVQTSSIGQIKALFNEN